MPYLETIPNFLLTYHRITRLSAGVLISPSRIIHRYRARVLPENFTIKVRKNFQKKFSQRRKRVIQHSPFLYSLLLFIAYFSTIPISIPYFFTFPNTHNFCPIWKSCRQPIGIEHEKPINTSANQNRVLYLPKRPRVLG